MSSYVCRTPGCAQRGASTAYKMCLTCRQPTAPSGATVPHGPPPVYSAPLVPAPAATSPGPVEYVCRTPACAANGEPTPYNVCLTCRQPTVPSGSPATMPATMVAAPYVCVNKYCVDAGRPTSTLQCLECRSATVRSDQPGLVIPPPYVRPRPTPAPAVAADRGGPRFVGEAEVGRFWTVRHFVDAACYLFTGGVALWWHPVWWATLLGIALIVYGLKVAVLGGSYWVSTAIYVLPVFGIIALFSAR